MFPFSQVLPFGSAINGFGTCSSDQDMVLLLEDLNITKKNRLVFQAKSAIYGGDRAQVQRYCEEVASIIQSFLPGCQDVHKILAARVPLIKYNHTLAGLECDLSMSSSSGLHMSCLLHLWGSTDWRVRPLVATVRWWAREHRLVKEMRPTQYFTNFTLTMLVVCYLQQKHQMLPSYSTLVDRATQEDIFVCQDGVDVRFLHNINQKKEELNKSYHSTITLIELLRGFFDFYSTFNFKLTALCPISGQSRAKDAKWTHSSALDIYNPLEPRLNVSYNINGKALSDFQEKCKQGRDRVKLLIQGQLGEDKEISDGLFAIVDDFHHQGGRKSKVPAKVRMPILGDLFNVEEKETKETIHEKNSPVTKLVTRVESVEEKVEVEVEDVPPVDEKLRINVGTLFTTAVRKKAKQPAPSRQETQRVEKLKAKYLRSNVKNYSHKL